MNDAYEQHRALLGKWLWILFCAKLAGLICSVLSMIPGVSQFSVLGDRAVSVLVIVALYMLVPVHARYQKALVFKCVALGSALLITLLNVDGLLSMLLALANAVGALIAAYQEYTAHSEVCRSYDPDLADKWIKLFRWEITVGVLSYVAVFLVVIPAVGAAALLAVGIAGIVLGILYLVYLYRTVKLFK